MGKTHNDIGFLPRLARVLQFRPTKMKLQLCWSSTPQGTLGMRMPWGRTPISQIIWPLCTWFLSVSQFTSCNQKDRKLCWKFKIRRIFFIGFPHATNRRYHSIAWLSNVQLQLAVRHWVSVWTTYIFVFNLNPEFVNNLILILILIIY